ncbi:hypothetical protein CTheo_8608 [Ceratobasidium theobromae]|uniref:NACHT domain-containing protein n=1 Tax=Ceratobasidium theobromae TaxID=1582974 RepID=A0A5N5Q844_9AGAM|nr:hypothetical protein CTheo_8608 [Ceratobasidium theobromae]
MGSTPLPRPVSVNMSSPPTLKVKKGFRNRLRQQYNRVFSFHSRSPSPHRDHGESSSPRSLPSTSQRDSLPIFDSGTEVRLPTNTTTGINLKYIRATAWSGLRNALGALQKGAELFPPLQAAISALGPCVDILERAAKNSQDYIELASELTTLSESLLRHMRSGAIPASDSITNIAISVEHQAKLIGEKQGHWVVKRLMESSADGEDLMKHFRRVEKLFRQLQTEANLSTWSIVNEQQAKNRLKDLKPAKLARYDSELSTDINRRTCTEHTRTTVLSELNDWSYDPNAADVYFMSGMAGTGKTTIACSFSKALEERKQLAASFFCTRNSPECRRASRIIPTIAYQLARYSMSFRSALCEILGNDPDIGLTNISKQFECLLKEPLVKIGGALSDNLVVVIDALDECDDQNGVGIFLDMIFRFGQDLPLRFFVTSRPEPMVYNKMASQGQDSRAILHLHEIEKSLVQADIELYLEEELKFMSPTSAQIEQLARRSGNLFIYAATLVRYIRPGKHPVDPRKRLESILAIADESSHKKRYAEIDVLYRAVLEAVLDEDGLEDGEAEVLRLVLWTVVCAQEPINIETISELAGIIDTDQAMAALKSLRSVVHFSESSGLASTLHASFLDFMFSEERSGSFFCDPTMHNQLLSRQCFSAMKNRLRFNICGLESSFLADSDVENLQDRIKKKIPPILSYACRYWCDHLRLTIALDDLSYVLDEFLSDRLLFWMEGRATSPDLIELVEDARHFVTSFAANPVSQCTPHIYLSMLPFCPRSSSVYKNHWKCTRGLMKVEGGAIKRREVSALASWRFETGVLSVAYSPDGARVAFSCRDGTVGIRDAYDGGTIIGPYKGHPDVIRSVAFSPDGTLLATGSGDQTVQIWYTRDGRRAADPFQGHTGEVNSVTFSPDGTRLASGSDDHTIRIWDPQNSTLVAGPCEGHTHYVWSVAFSPDGTLVVSGSGDTTVRIWHVGNGRPAADAFEGHTDHVNTVAFSPDGTCIASGSYDHTIRIWDPQSGNLMTSPFEGHTDSVWSVAFSPDGTRIVSGSFDCTIRVWRVSDGTLIAGPFVGHSARIRSVSYSPDGTQIISACEDCTIRVWNPQKGIVVAADPSDGHTAEVMAIAPSPDGTRIASASNDFTIRVWDTRSGASITDPFKGHTDRVWGVAFSPDGTQIVSVSCDTTIRVWYSQDGTLAAGPFEGHTDDIQSVAFSPNGALVASGSDDMTICLWDLKAGAIVGDPLSDHTGPVTSVAFSPDGSWLASCSKDRTIRIRHTHNGDLFTDPFIGHTAEVNSVAFSHDSTRIVSGSLDLTIRVWDPRDGKLVNNPFRGHTDRVTSVAFSPDDAFIVSGSDDYTVRVWSARDGTPITKPFEGHTAGIASTLFLSDGAYVVSASLDCTIRAWSLTSARAALNPPPSGACADVAQPRTVTQPHQVNETPDPDDNSHCDSNLLPACYPHTAALGDCAIRDDGWIVNSESQLLFWVPSEVLRSFLPAHCKYVISPYGSLEIDFSNVLMGDRWHECYLSG